MYDKKPYYKKKAVKIYLLGEHILTIVERNHKSVYYNEVSTGNSTVYNISFDMMIGIGYGSEVWVDSRKGFLSIVGTEENWHKFYALVNRDFNYNSKHDCNY